VFAEVVIRTELINCLTPGWVKFHSDVSDRVIKTRGVPGRLSHDMNGFPVRDESFPRFSGHTKYIFHHISDLMPGFVVAFSVLKSISRAKGII